MEFFVSQRPLFTNGISLWDYAPQELPTKIHVEEFAKPPHLWEDSRCLKPMPQDNLTDNMTWDWVGDNVLIIVSKPGTDADKDRDTKLYDLLLNDVQGRDFEKVLSLSIGAPNVNSVQRKELSKVFKGKRIVSVFDGGALTRGVITALGWLGMNIIGYNLKEISKAISEITPEGQSELEVQRIVRRLTDKVGITNIIETG